MLECGVRLDLHDQDGVHARDRDRLAREPAQVPRVELARPRVSVGGSQDGPQLRRLLRRERVGRAGDPELPCGGP